MPTYLSAYEDHLTRLIEQGGNETDVERAVGDYNRLNPVKVAAWVKDAGLRCSYCEEPALTSDVKPTDETTCAEHRA